MKLSQAFTVIDTESTGPDPQKDRILQIGAAVFRGFEAEDVRSRLVNPWISVPRGAFEVHEISHLDVREAPAFEAVWPGEFILEEPTVSYNGFWFDLPLLFEECRRSSIGWEELKLPHIDLFIFTRWHFRGLRSRKLGDICARFGIRAGGEGLHDAGVDCEITGRLLALLVQKGVIPDDLGEALEHQHVLREALKEEDRKYSYWFYEDRLDGSLRMGCGRHTGKLIKAVPQKDWADLYKRATDAPDHIRAMLKEFAGDLAGH